MITLKCKKCMLTSTALQDYQKDILPMVSRSS